MPRVQWRWLSNHQTNPIWPQNLSGTVRGMRRHGTSKAERQPIEADGCLFRSAPVFV